MKIILHKTRTTYSNKPSTQIQVEVEDEVMVKAKVVAILEIKILDNNSQMIHSNNSHTEVVEEANLKAGGAKEDVAIGTDNNLD